MIADEVQRELIECIHNSLEKGLCSIELSMPHRLYATDRQSKLFEAATSKNSNYKDNIDAPIISLLENNLESIIQGIKQQANFIDLGPGYPQKSLIIVDELLRRSKNILYYAVDVSPYFLDRAIFHAQERGIMATRIERRFEDLAPILDRDLTKVGIQRVIFLGLTFSNFPLDDITNILSDITRSDDICIICYQASNDVCEEDLVKPYNGSKVQQFAFEPLKILGLSGNDFIYQPSLQGNAIETRFISLHDIKWDKIIIPKNTIFITAKSYRFHASEVRAALEKKMVIKNEYIENKSKIVLVKLTGRDE